MHYWFNRIRARKQTALCPAGPTFRPKAGRFILVQVEILERTDDKCFRLAEDNIPDPNITAPRCRPPVYQRQERSRLQDFILPWRGFCVKTRWQGMKTKADIVANWLPRYTG